MRRVRAGTFSPCPDVHLNPRATCTIHPGTYRSPIETGLYYIHHRYYDPQLCRWINADEPDNLGANGEFISHNLFAYCGNNPVSRDDPKGTDWRETFAIGIATALIGIAILATLPFSGPLLAGAGIAAATVSTAASVTVATGISVATGSVILAMSSGGKEPTRIGKEGERQAGIQQSEKKPIEVNGRTRVPDALDSDFLTEVKNTKYISNTLQLRDYAEYAGAAEIALRLIVRAGTGTTVANTVIEAGWNIIRLIK